MQSVVRHDYFPSESRISARRFVSKNRLRPADVVGSVHTLDVGWRLSPVSKIDAPRRGRINFCSLTVAVLGLTVYLGVPTAVLVLLGLELVG